MSSPDRNSAPPATVGDLHLGFWTSALLFGLSGGLGLFGLSGFSSNDFDVFGLRLRENTGKRLRSLLRMFTVYARVKSRSFRHRALPGGAFKAFEK